MQECLFIKCGKMRYFLDTDSGKWNIVKTAYDKDMLGKIVKSKQQYKPIKNEVEKTEAEFLEYKKTADLLAKKDQKRQECQATILAKYSLTDQANLERAVSRITSQAFFEQRQPTESERAELKEAQAADAFINAVLKEFRDNGADADFSQFV